MIEEWIEKGLLIQSMPDPQKAESSLRLAGAKIKTAGKEFEAGIYSSAFLSAYTAMFHSARAILFRDGFKERNHYALYLYLRERYIKKLGLAYVNELNNFRTIRHKVIYGDDELHTREVQEAEAESAIRVATEFLGAIRKLL